MLPTRSDVRLVTVHLSEHTVRFSSVQFSSRCYLCVPTSDWWFCSTTETPVQLKILPMRSDVRLVTIQLKEHTVQFVLPMRSDVRLESLLNYRSTQFSSVQFSSVQFRSRCYLCAQKIPYALCTPLRLSEVFPTLPLKRAITWVLLHFPNYAGALRYDLIK